MPEVPKQPPIVAIDDSELARSLYGLLNHEARMVAVATAALVLPEPFTAVELNAEVTARQGYEPAWKQSSRMGFSYCKPFERLLFEPTTKRGAPAYETVKASVPLYLAYCGMGMAWSSRYTDISLQQILGYTQSNRRRSLPETRLKIYSYLLDQDEPRSHTEIGDAIGLPAGNALLRLAGQLDRMGALGIVTNEPGRAAGIARSAVRLAPDYVEPIADLCKSLRGMVNPTKAKRHREWAEAIIASEREVYLLMAKARHFSSSGKRRLAEGGEDLPTTIKKIVQELGQVSIDQTLAEVAFVTGRVYERSHITQVLGDLVDAAHLRAESRLRGKNNRRSIYWFELRDKKD